MAKKEVEMITVRMDGKVLKRPVKASNFTDVPRVNVMSGKLAGVGASYGTTCRLNPNCMRLSQIPGSICSKCYAMNQTSYQDNLELHLENNAVLLTMEELTPYQVEALKRELTYHSPYGYIRVNSFGDLFGKVDTKNYFTMADAMPGHTHGLWTKIPEIIADTINDGVRIPENMSIGQSSLFIGKEDGVKPEHKSFINFTFTVLEKTDFDAVQEDKNHIKCGGKSCEACGFRCYNAKKDGYGVNGNDVLHVYELRK